MNPRGEQDSFEAFSVFSGFALRFPFDQDAPLVDNDKRTEVNGQSHRGPTTRTPKKLIDRTSMKTRDLIGETQGVHTASQMLRFWKPT